MHAARLLAERNGHPVNSTVETLEDNKVKVSVTVDETEFEDDLNAAFKRIAQEVNLPGFRRGKAPRKLLEARIGLGPAREEALREALPKYYSDAVVEHDVDVIAAPELDITEGQEEGPITFEAIVEVRPVVTVAGYDGLIVGAPTWNSQKLHGAPAERIERVYATVARSEPRAAHHAWRRHA